MALTNSTPNNVELYLATQYTDGDTTLDCYAKNDTYKLTDQISSSLVTSFRCIGISRSDNDSFMNMAISNVAENGTFQGNTRYTLTLRTSDGGNPMVGLANTDDGTDADANIIAGNKLSTLPADSLVQVTVGTANFNEIYTAFQTNVAERFVQFFCYDKVSDVAVGDGRAYFQTPAKYDGDAVAIANATVLTAGATGDTTIQVAKEGTAFTLGDSTTQFDITDEGSNTFRYTYDGTGTDPNIEDSDSSIRVGDEIVVNAQNFNAANNDTFTVTAVSDDYFEVTNASGVAESNKTIGTGSIIRSAWRDILSTAITIASGATTGSGVVNTSRATLNTGDMLQINIDSVSTTAPKGLVVNIEMTS